MSRYVEDQEMKEEDVLRDRQQPSDASQEHPHCKLYRYDPHLLLARRV